MAVYLLDTTTFSYLMRDDPLVHARVAGLTAADRLTICSTVRGEILFGIERLPPGTRRRTLEAKAHHLFAALACEPILPVTADHYARLKRTAEKAGTSLDENDLWIAATAQSLGAVLVTTDGDYARLSVLATESWTIADRAP